MLLHRSRETCKRGAAVIGIAAAALLVTAPAAGAAEPVPSPTCELPSLTVVPSSVSPGTMIVVTGEHFSGCPAEGDPTEPSASLEVRVGIATDQEVGAVLGTAQTAADGSFTLSVPIPDVASAGDTIALAAASEDPLTGLAYAAVVPLTYTGGTAVPTGVPAGTGGFGASDDESGSSGAVLAGGVGVALATAGVVGLRRRRVSVHS